MPTQSEHTPNSTEAAEDTPVGAPADDRSGGATGAGGKGACDPCTNSQTAGEGEGMAAAGPLAARAEGAQAGTTSSPARRGRGRPPLAQFCQVCNVEVSLLGGFFKRYRICRQHSTAPVIEWDNVPQRFCQQCGCFHELHAFQGDQRSCREQLAYHAARRRQLRQQRRQAAQAVQHPAGASRGGSSGASSPRGSPGASQGGGSSSGEEREGAALPSVAITLAAPVRPAPSLHLKQESPASWEVPAHPPSSVRITGTWQPAVGPSPMAGMHPPAPCPAPPAPQPTGLDLPSLDSNRSCNTAMSLQLPPAKEVALLAAAEAAADLQRRQAEQRQHSRQLAAALPEPELGNPALSWPQKRKQASPEPLLPGPALPEVGAASQELQLGLLHRSLPAAAAPSLAVQASSTLPQLSLSQLDALLLMPQMPKRAGQEPGLAAAALASSTHQLQKAVKDQAAQLLSLVELLQQAQQVQQAQQAVQAQWRLPQASLPLPQALPALPLPQPSLPQLLGLAEPAVAPRPRALRPAAPEPGQPDQLGLLLQMALAEQQCVAAQAHGPAHAAAPRRHGAFAPFRT